MKLKKLIRFISINTICILVFTSSIYASGAITYNKITLTGTLNAIGASTLTLPTDFSNTKIDCILIEKDGKNTNANVTVSGNAVTISPSSYFEGDSIYVIKIITNAGKKYLAEVTAQDTFDYDTNDKIFTKDLGDTYPEFAKPSGNRLIEITAKPDKGFDYPYLLLIPSGTSNNSNKKFMVVEPNNSPYATDIFGYDEEMAKIFIHAHGSNTNGAGGFQVATSIKTPLLIPIFPRSSDWQYTPYYQFLDRKCFTSGSRPDEQLVAMINDAKKRLGSKGITIENKVFMIGFSTSAKFVQRFTIIHPELVKATCTGGIAGTTTLPLTNYKGTDFRFPVGVSDLENLTGEKFNSDAFKNVAQFLYMGENDNNDATQWKDCFEEQDAKTIWNVLGEKQMPDRWKATQEAIKSAGFDQSLQFATYRGIDHNISNNMFDDFISFFKANMGDTITKIQPHDSAY